MLAQNPAIAPFVIGGDHSNAWPVVAALARARKDRWAIVQPDAPPTSSSTASALKYCFATWSYHANELFGRDGRLVQVGTRASGRDRGHWESSLNVRQFWAEECRRRPDESLDEVIAHLRRVGATAIYFSNDIDGTDEGFADATGTPSPGASIPSGCSGSSGGSATRSASSAATSWRSPRRYDPKVGLGGRRPRPWPRATCAPRSRRPSAASCSPLG